MKNNSNSMVEDNSSAYDVGRKACMALIVLAWLLIVGGLFPLVGFLFAIVQRDPMNVYLEIITAVSLLTGGIGGLAGGYVGLAIIDNTLTNLRVLEKLSEQNTVSY